MLSPSEILDLIENQIGSEPRSLSQQAYQHIRRKIISTKLPPGALIDEGALRADLEMGRTPIREAIQRLSQDKLVTILPRRGMLVTEIGITDLQRLFEIRYDLEGLAAELAARRGTPEQFELMAQVLSYLPEDGDPDEPERLIAIDEASHRLIYAASDNKFLEDALYTLYGQSLRLWYFTLGQVGTLQNAVKEHRSILEALKAGDGERSCRLLREHVRTFHEQIQKAMLGMT